MADGGNPIGAGDADDDAPADSRLRKRALGKKGKYVAEGKSGQQTEDKHDNRKNLYAPKYPLFTVTEGLLSGNKTPFWVKLPRYGPDVTRADPELGIFMSKGQLEGMFYCPSTSTKLPAPIADIIRVKEQNGNNENIGFAEFRNAGYYNVITLALKSLDKSLIWHNDIWWPDNTHRIYKFEAGTVLPGIIGENNYNLGIGTPTQLLRKSVDNLFDTNAPGFTIAESNDLFRHHQNTLFEFVKAFICGHKDEQGRKAWFDYLKGLSDLVKKFIDQDPKKNQYYSGPYIKFIVASNGYRVAKDYISNTTRSVEHQIVRRSVYPGGGNPQAGTEYINGVKRLRALSRYMRLKRMPDQLCPRAAQAAQPGSGCPKPNNSVLSDVTLTFCPNGFDLLIPLLFVEITGQKDVWGKMEENHKGWLCAMHALCFMPTAFYLEVGHTSAELFRFRRLPGISNIQVHSEVFEFNTLPTGPNRSLFDPMFRLTLALVKLLFHQLQYIHIGVAAATRLRKRKKEYPYKLCQPARIQKLCNTCFHFGNSYEDLDVHIPNEQLFTDTDSDADVDPDPVDPDDDDNDGGGGGNGNNDDNGGNNDPDNGGGGGNGNDPDNGGGGGNGNDDAGNGGGGGNDQVDMDVEPEETLDYIEDDDDDEVDLEEVRDILPLPPNIDEIIAQPIPENITEMYPSYIQEIRNEIKLEAEQRNEYGNYRDNIMKKRLRDEERVRAALAFQEKHRHKFESEESKQKKLAADEESRKSLPKEEDFVLGPNKIPDAGTWSIVDHRITPTGARPKAAEPSTLKICDPILSYRGFVAERKRQKKHDVPVMNLPEEDPGISWPQPFEENLSTSPYPIESMSTSPSTSAGYWSMTDSMRSSPDGKQLGPSSYGATEPYIHYSDVGTGEFTSRESVMRSVTEMTKQLNKPGEFPLEMSVSPSTSTGINKPGDIPFPKSMSPSPSTSTITELMEGSPDDKTVSTD